MAGRPCSRGSSPPPPSSAKPDCALAALILVALCLAGCGDDGEAFRAQPHNASAGAAPAHDLRPDLGGGSARANATGGSTSAGMGGNASAGRSPPVAMLGHCSAADAARMAMFGSGNQDGTFPKTVAQCGKAAYRFFGGFKVAKYTQCITDRIGVSSPCAQCFGPSGLYGFRHCKLKCLFGSWCGEGCLSCVQPSNQGARECAGVWVPTAPSC